jgi:hypothetical protein
MVHPKWCAKKAIPDSEMMVAVMRNMVLAKDYLQIFLELVDDLKEEGAASGSPSNPFSCIRILYL